MRRLNLDFLVELFGDRRAPDGSLVRDNFVIWFNESQILDKDGRPMRLYHGTPHDFSFFDPTKSNSRSKTGVPEGTFCFSTCPENASSYAGQYTYMTGTKTFRDGANIMPVYLSMQKPLRTNARGGSWRELIYRGEEHDINTLADYAKAKGYDGLIVSNVYDTSEGSGIKADTYFVFSPLQIKSATGNSGLFSRTCIYTDDHVDPLRQAELERAARAYLYATQPSNKRNLRQLELFV